MEVIKATSYGFRTVIVVCHNPDEPEYIHSDDSAHPPLNVNGCIPGEGEPPVCASNHQLQEFVWDEVEQYDEDGILRSPESFWAEICEQCVSPPDPEEMVSLIGLES
jgi:hypothetical protein